VKKILFRADAEKSIGTGDLVSLICLSGLFSEKGWKCYFVVRDHEPAIRILSARKVRNVYKISRDMSVRDEIDLIKKVCEKEEIDCLLMEITKGDLTEYDTLGKPAPVKACVNFDGIINPDFDIVINWCVDASDKLYEDYKGCGINFILGFENTILPASFDWDSISSRKYNGIKNVLIAMGGVDEFDITGKIVAVLHEKLRNFNVRVIIGAAYENKKKLTEYMQTRYPDFVIKENVNDLLGDYLWADLAFSAGGLTSSELVASRTPVMLFASCGHQVNRCKYFARKGLAYYVGYRTDVKDEKITEGLDHMISNISLFRKNLSITDFRGGNEKIFKNINSCRQSKELV
jgi:spore coat polysaccharide biosynthesis predicted glycosyltransferase SpsG